MVCNLLLFHCGLGMFGRFPSMKVFIASSQQFDHCLNATIDMINVHCSQHGAHNPIQTVNSHGTVQRQASEITNSQGHRAETVRGLICNAKNAFKHYSCSSNNMSSIVVWPIQNLLCQVHGVVRRKMKRKAYACWIQIV